MWNPAKLTAKRKILTKLTVSCRHEEDCSKLKNEFVQSRQQMVNSQIIENDIKNALCRYDDFDKRSE